MFKNQKHIQNIYIQVVIDAERNEKKDIIHFYNEVYIKLMKDYIIATKPSPSEGNGNSRTPVITSQGNITPGINKP